jgi:hypothetical protein
MNSQTLGTVELARRRGEELQIDADRMMHHRALHQTRPVASPRTAGVSRSVAATPSPRESPRVNVRVRTEW